MVRSLIPLAFFSFLGALAFVSLGMVAWFYKLTVVVARRRVELQCANG